MKMLFILLAAVLFFPGEVVSDEVIREQGVEAFFSCGEVPDEVFGLMKGKSFKSDCTVPRDSLKYLVCLHRDADGRAIVGEMVLGNRIADRVLLILKELFLASYPIERMRLIDYWDADDDKSMRANNSSAFNFRFVSGTSVVSAHGSGLAVDINPLYNPYYKKTKDGREIVQPSNAGKFLDRNNPNPYLIRKDDLCCRLFKENGFEWGGDWQTCKDYQHFELK